MAPSPKVGRVSEVRSQGAWRVRKLKLKSCLLKCKSLQLRLRQDGSAWAWGGDVTGVGALSPQRLLGGTSRLVAPSGLHMVQIYHKLSNSDTASDVSKQGQQYRTHLVTLNKYLIVCFSVTKSS